MATRLGCENGYSTFANHDSHNSQPPSMRQRFLVYRVSSPFVERPRLELAEWILPYLIGNAWLFCTSYRQLFERLSNTSPSLARSRGWVCPRCEKSNLECLPDPTPGSSNPETVVPDPPQTIPEVGVIQAVEDETPDTNVSDSPSPQTPQDPPEASVAAAIPAVPQTTVTTRSPVANPRPPLLLDTAICVLLVLAVALLFRRFT